MTESINKPELLSILELDARDLREERAAIIEYEAGFTRAEAESRAWVELGKGAA